MKSSDDTNTTDTECESDDADDSTLSRLSKKPLRNPLSADAVDLMGEFKRKYPDIIVDNNNHETDHRGGQGILVQ